MVKPALAYLDHVAWGFDGADGGKAFARVVAPWRQGGRDCAMGGPAAEAGAGVAGEVGRGDGGGGGPGAGAGAGGGGEVGGGWEGEWGESGLEDGAERCRERHRPVV